jgi:spectinomycin phosphotransferase
VETFRPVSTELARRVDERIATREVDTMDPLAARVARRWTAERATIRRLVDRADELGRRIRDGRAPRPLVLCHADLHTGNVLLDPDGGLAIVDWDELILAPRERDLMFIRGSAVADVVTDDQADAFERGYGSAGADPLLIAYYRIDWAVQDLAGFANQVLFDATLDPPSRARAAALFVGQFDPGNEVDTAIAADGGLGR